MNHWRIAFSGDIKPTVKHDVPIHVFLRGAEAYGEAEGLTEAQLLQRVLHLLRGTAYEWYLNQPKRLKTWRAFKLALKDAFLPPDHDSTLLMEAEQRKQQPNEPVIAYLNDMDTKFRAMAEPVNERHQVCIVKRNLLPYFAMSLGVADPKSLRELATVCKRIEAAKSLLRNREVSQGKSKDFRPKGYPNRVNSVSAIESNSSDDEYNNEEQSAVCVVSRSVRRGKAKADETKQKTKVEDVENTKIEACFNCDAEDHIQRRCPKPWAKHCYKCGHKNVTHKECPKCAPAVTSPLASPDSTTQ